MPDLSECKVIRGKLYCFDRHDNCFYVANFERVSDSEVSQVILDDFLKTHKFGTVKEVNNA
jgi:small nuclear ribonucleoprotein (snRNP)-like protein